LQDEVAQCSGFFGMPGLLTFQRFFQQRKCVEFLHRIVWPMVVKSSESGNDQRLKRVLCRKAGLGP
jgi:hypothetical protein